MSGRSVIVSGGTGALGRAVVSTFLRAGDRVTVPFILTAERDAIAAACAAEIDAGRLVLLEADVAEAAGASAVASAAGPADVLVNGVGGFAGGAPVHETALEIWDRMYRMNVRTAVALSSAVIPGMISRGAGAIVCIASQAARQRPAGLAAYAASKDAIVVLVETLQKELVAHGIRVNAVAPGTIDTPANRAAMPDVDPSAWTPPAQIADAIHWLASPAATPVRGATLPV